PPCHGEWSGAEREPSVVRPIPDRPLVNHTHLRLLGVRFPRGAGGAGRAVAVAAGAVTGALTLVGQAVLPTEANRLANSGAIWVTVAFAVGWRTPSNATAAVAGLLALLAAVVGSFE